MTTTAKDYLAIILIGAGSTFARGTDRDDTARRCVSICASDWGGLYDLAEKDVQVNVFDVTGHDKVWWDSRGLWSGETQLDVPKEVETWTFAKRGRVNHQKKAA